MANEDRIRQVVAAIEASPQQFDMRLFINECGTTFCFAGWALKLAGEDMDYWRSEYWASEADGAINEADNSAERMVSQAAEWLGINDREAERLFFYTNAGDDIERLKVHITNLFGISFDAVVS